MLRRVLAIAPVIALLAACKNDATSPPVTELTGTLAINVVGLPSSAPAAGSVTVLRTNVPGQTSQAFPLSPDGTLELVLPVGTYSVSYTAPAGYTAYSALYFSYYPVTTATVVAVKANDVTGVSFSVKPATGTLEVVANFVSGPYPTSGGSVSIVRTDTEGAVPLTLVIPNQATEGYFAAVELTPGTYGVTYAPPTGYRMVSGLASESASVIVPPSSVAAVTFDVTPQIP